MAATKGDLSLLKATIAIPTTLTKSTLGTMTSLYLGNLF
jgi:hypothetical protein